MGISLLLILLVLSSKLLSSQSTDRIEIRGVAKRLAGELSKARHRALSQSIPVAICFPSGNGRTPTFQSFYRLEGEARPAVRGSSRLVHSGQEACVFVGHWALTGSSTSEVNEPGGGEHLRAFGNYLSSWLPNPKDPAIVFFPTGEVVTNNLPRFEGEYHLVVCQNADWSESDTLDKTSELSLSAPLRANLTSASQAYTITLEPNGQVRVSSGVASASSGVGSLAIDADTFFPAPILTPKSNSSPLFASLQSNPEPSPGLLGAGIDCSVAPDGQLTLRMAANDLDPGDTLYCEFSAEKVMGTGIDDGQFSLNGYQRMEFEPATEEWTAECAWQPGPNALVGDTYDITARVKDAQGATVDAPASAVVRSVVVEEHRLFFGTGTQAYSIRDDGSDLRLLATEDAPGAGTFGFNDVSPDGKFALLRQGNRLLRRALDGSLDVELHSVAGERVERAKFNQTGTRIVGVLNDIPSSGERRIVLMNGDGSGMSVLKSEPGVSFNHPHFSPDEQWIAYQRDDEFDASDYPELHIVKVDGTVDHHILTFPGPSQYQVPVGFLASTPPKLLIHTGGSGNLDSLELDLVSGSILSRTTLQAPGYRRYEVDRVGARASYSAPGYTVTEFIIDDTSFGSPRTVTLPIPMLSDPVWGP